MPAFQHRSMNSKGKEEQGLIEADSPRAARQLLRDQGLFPVEIKTATDKNTSSFFSFLSTRKPSSSVRSVKSPGIKELTLFTRQFATLLAAGLPIEAAITAVAEQTEKPATKALILSVRSRIREGHTLAAALRDYPAAFSELYCATIAAGEKSGHLDIVLARLADYTEQQYEMRQKIMHALIYPIIMIIVAVGITGFLLEYVVPKMIAVYTNTGQALPVMTRVLIHISAGVETFGIYILGILLIGIVVFRWMMKHRPTFRERIHRLLLKNSADQSFHQNSEYGTFFKDFCDSVLCRRACCRSHDHCLFPDYQHPDQKLCDRSGSRGQRRRQHSSCPETNRLFLTHEYSYDCQR